MAERDEKAFLLVTDLDWTFVDHDDETGMEELADILQEHRKAHGTKFVYSTGRSPALYKELRDKYHLPRPDALVTSVGTEVYFDDAKWECDGEWAKHIGQNWNRDLVVDVIKKRNWYNNELKPQPTTEQRDFKVSFFVEDNHFGRIQQDINDALSEAGVKATVIYSGGCDLDILPIRAGKGNAMVFLSGRFNFEPHQVVCSGDSGNDIALFSMGSQRGIIVGNAMKELLEWHKNNPSDDKFLAKARCGRGIVEGLRHFGFVE
eukprot:Clim_evm7s70 gene=Clim_evmTU7s70